MKIRIVVFDLCGGALEWLDRYGNEDHIELCEIITMDDDSPIPITDLPKYDNWDLLLIFENGVRTQVNELMRKLAISEDRIMYPLDLDGSVIRNIALSMYIFKDTVYRYAKYHSFRKDGDKYAIAASDELFFMNLSTDDSILPTTYLSGDVWAQDEMRLYYELSNQYFEFSDKQNLFCDIGANIGSTCIYFKKKLDRNVNILAFEPSHENYKMLQVNAILNDIDISENMLVPIGLSDERAEGTLMFDPKNPGGSSLIHDNGSGEQEKILLTTFDDYLGQTGIDPARIKYLWIDVEGYEARFLKGAEKTLESINVPVFMEFIPQFYMNKTGEFELLMNEIEKHFKSYICAQSPRAGKLPVENLWKEQDNENGSWDLFLMKE